jgi:outer membrane receptor for ferrienterochelin and colicins
MPSFHLRLLLPLIFSGMFAVAQNNKDTTATFHVSGLCAQCKQRIEKTLKVRGIRSADWNVATRQVSIVFDPVRMPLEKIHKLIAGAGHDTGLEKASEEVYQALPDCCHYREQPEGSSSVPVSRGLRGLVVQGSEEKTIPLEGVTITNKKREVVASTDKHGEFDIPLEGNDLLVISYSGFRTDTVVVSGLTDIQITMREKNDLGAVVVSARKRSSYIDLANPFRTAIITKKELLKAACCNLSESFETNPSVDVSYNDALTGSKQIQLLGLSGNYTQLTVENLPGPRGIATPLGLNSIAGPWVESIQMIKGAGSVVNGYESIAGQINVELRKPDESAPFYLNGYVNGMGKTDVNLNLARKTGKKWSTGLLLHDDFLVSKQDQNKDGFRDQPTGNQFSAMHRWHYLGEQGLMSDFGVKILVDDRTGGQMDYEPGMDRSNLYGLGIKTERYEVFGKIGYVFPENLSKSFGLQLSAFDHRQDAYFGKRDYDARQKNFYANLIYQVRDKSKKHQLKTGAAFIYDDVREKLGADEFSRREAVPGVFAEYTYSPVHELDIVAGMRADHNSLYGWFATPRINVRYEPFRGTTVRVSAGRGQRTANLIAEHIGILASSRTLSVASLVKPGEGFGMEPEVAWNKGLGVDQRLTLFGRPAAVSADYYRNDFSSQVVLDLEDPDQARFYQLDGKSFSNSWQVEFSFMPVNKLDVRLAYRQFDVRTTYNGKLLQQPLLAAHRAFANLAYDLNGWKFDYTINYTGRKRLPSTSANPPAFQAGEWSPAFVLMNGQVSKAFGKKKKFDVYLGGENLGNFMQKNAIIDAANPFGNYFDASLVWGPVTGRNVYVGFRYEIE